MLLSFHFNFFLSIFLISCLLIIYIVLYLILFKRSKLSRYFQYHILILMIQVNDFYLLNYFIILILVIKIFF